MNRAPNPYSEAEVRRAIQATKVVTDTHASEISVINGDISIIDGDIITIDGRLDALEAGSAYTAESDATIAIGQPLYMKLNGHVDLALANDATKNRVIGLASIAASPTFIASYISDGKITLADWTAIAGSTNLTPGGNYYLKEGLISVPLYSNPCGSGNRTALITMATTMTNHGYITQLIDGINVSGTLWWELANPITGLYLRFDFGVGVSKLITEAKWYQSAADTQGIWQWQGSSNGTSWSNIGNTFTLGGSATQTITELSANVTGYRYYQLLGVSGQSSSSPYLYEIEFKIDNWILGSGLGQITAVAPTAVGSYLVYVGRALSTVDLKVEIEPSILL